MSQEEQADSCPWVVRGGLALPGWTCHRWSRDQWSRHCADAKFRFRVHERAQTQPLVQWEHQALAYVDGTVSQLFHHCAGGGGGPFEAYPLQQYCLYSAYNHLETSLSSSMNWTDLADHLADPRIEASSLNGTTFWIGTAGAYTPCHQDTYGYNYVVQLLGRKRWILFPPDDTSNLYPTRIPYEESSIFSQLNMAGTIDVTRWPLAGQLRPYTVLLEPGDLLYVPYHWWHYVQNVDDVSISVNRWVEDPVHGHTDRLTECVTQLLFQAVRERWQPETQHWLNIGVAEQLMDDQALFRMIDHLIAGEAPADGPRPAPPNVAEYLKQGSATESLQLVAEPSGLVEATTTRQDVTNSLLHPRVISLIVSHLRRRRRPAGAPFPV